jgi:hypothetical protein
MACIFCLFYFVELLFTIPLLRDRQWRSTGYGLLTMLLVAPVVAVRACLALSTQPPA